MCVDGNGVRLGTCPEGVGCGGHRCRSCTHYCGIRPKQGISNCKLVQINKNSKLDFIIVVISRLF
jgi:hypothetical protein